MSCLEELQIKHLHIQLDRLPGLGLYMRQALFGTQAVCNQTLTQVSEIFCNFVWFLLIVWVACRFMSVFFFSHLFGPLLGMRPLEKFVCFT